MATRVFTIISIWRVCDDCSVAATYHAVLITVMCSFKLEGLEKLCSCFQYNDKVSQGFIGGFSNTDNNSCVL